MKKYTALLFFIFYVLFALPQSFAGEDSTFFNLKTPYHTVRTFSLNLKSDNWHPELAARTFRLDGLRPEEAQDAAVKLKQVMEVQGIELKLNQVPNKAAYKDSTRNINPFRYVLTEKLPDIYLQKYGSRWMFPPNVAARSRMLYEEAFPFGSDKLKYQMNRQLKYILGEGNAVFLGLHFWQWCGLLLILIIGTLVYTFTKYFAGRWLVNKLNEKGYRRIANEFIMPVVRPSCLLLSLLVLRLGFRLLDMPFNFYKYLYTTLQIAIPLVSTAILYYMADVIAGLMKRLADKSENTMDDQLVPMVRKGLKALVLIVGGVWLLSNLDVDIIPLLTGLSIGGLAFALAAQDTLKNIFGSMMIIIDKPFQIGDWITSGSEIDGLVEEVGFRSTRIRTFSNSLITVPNGKLADMVINNHGLRKYRRFLTRLSVRYDTPADLLELFVEGLNQIVEDHPKTWKEFYEVHLNEFGSSSLEIMFWVFFEVPGYSEELKARQEVMLKIIRLAQLLGVEFAFPTQTLHVEDFPDKNSLATTYEKDMLTKREQMRKHLKGVSSTPSNSN